MTPHVLQDERIDFVRMRDRRHVVGVRDHAALRVRNRLGDEPRDQLRGTGRVRAAQDERRNANVHAGRERGRLAEQAAEVMRDADGEVGELRLALLGGSLPGAGSAPVVDESLHAAPIVAGQDRAVDRSRHGPDLGQRLRVAFDLVDQHVEAARLDQGQRMQPFRKAQREAERDCAAIGVSDQVERLARRDRVPDGGRLMGKTERAVALPARSLAVAVEVDRDGLEAGELGDESVPLPCGACRAVDQDDAIRRHRSSRADPNRSVSAVDQHGGMHAAPFPVR